MSTAPASNQAQITAYLRAKGLTAAQIAGVLGNWQIESGLSSTAHNDREGAIGLAQWEGPRRTALRAYAASVGKSETDLGAQLGFWWQEMTGSERGSLTALLQTTTPQAAATVFDQKYERSSAASLPARVAAATQFATGGIVGGSGVPAGGVQTVGFDVPGWLGGIAALISPSVAMEHPEWLVGGGAAVDGAVTGVTGAVTGFLGSIGHWIVDALLIIMGLGMVIVAVVIIAKGADSGSSSTTVVTPAPAGKAKGGAGESSTAEAAEVAA